MTVDLERAKGGDEREFASLVEPFRRELQLHCYRLLGSVQDAEDLVQETLLAAWRGIDGFEERTRRKRYHCGRAHDRREHQPRGRRREAADRVEVDDLEGEDQSGAEVVERVPALKNEDRLR